MGQAGNLVDALPETRNFAVALLHSHAGSEYLLVWFAFFSDFSAFLSGIQLARKKTSFANSTCRLNVKLLGLELSLQNSQH